MDYYSEGLKWEINGKSCRSDTDVICKVDLTKRSNYPQSPQIFPKIYLANKIWILAVTTGGRQFFYSQRKQSVINVYKNFKLHYFISRVFPQYIKLNFFSPKLSEHSNYQRLESHPSPSTVSLSPPLSERKIVNFQSKHRTPGEGSVLGAGSYFHFSDSYSGSPCRQYII